MCSFDYHGCSVGSIAVDHQSQEQMEDFFRKSDDDDVWMFEMGRFLCETENNCEALTGISGPEICRQIECRCCRAR